MKIFTLSTLKIVIITFSFFGFAQNANLKKGKVNAKNYYQEIPFEFLKNKIVIPVTIEGHTYRFLLDTGAPNIVSSEVYQAIKSKTVTSISTSDANSKSQNLDVVTIKSLKLGDIEFKGFNALVFDLNGSHIFKCFGIDGFIGSNLLRHSIIQIDADQNLLKLTDQAKLLKLNKKESDKIKLVGNQSSPYVQIQLTGKENGREMVLIDTGMGGLYDVSRDNFEIFKTKSIFNIIGESDGASSVSLFGEVPTNRQLRVHLPKLMINDLILENHITHTSNSDNSKIGADLLNYGVMTIDYKNKRFYFEPKTNNVDLSKSIPGFTTTIKNKRIVIGYVWDRSLQEKLNYGDVILAINGKELNDSNFCNSVINDSSINLLNEFVLNIEKEADGQVIDISITKKELLAVLNDFNISLN
nr:retropepsin-like aspartic protease [uncultured Psychroserpens sp.]